MAYVSQKSRASISIFQKLQVAKDVKMMSTAKNIQTPKTTSNDVYMNKGALDACIHKVGEIERRTFQFEKQIEEKRRQR